MQENVTYWHCKLWPLAWEGNRAWPVCWPDTWRPWELQHPQGTPLIIWSQGTKRWQLKRNWSPSVMMNTAAGPTGRGTSGSPMTALCAHAATESQNAWLACAATQTVHDQSVSKGSAVLPAPCPPTGVGMEVWFGNVTANSVLPASYSNADEAGQWMQYMLLLKCSHGQTATTTFCSCCISEILQALARSQLGTVLGLYASSPHPSKCILWLPRRSVPHIIILTHDGWWNSRAGLRPWRGSSFPVKLDIGISCLEEATCQFIYCLLSEYQWCRWQRSVQGRGNRPAVLGWPDVGAGRVHHLLLCQEWQGSMCGEDVRPTTQVQEPSEGQRPVLPGVQGRSRSVVVTPCCEWQLHMWTPEILHHYGTFGLVRINCTDIQTAYGGSTVSTTSVEIPCLSFGSIHYHRKHFSNRSPIWNVNANCSCSTGSPL